MVTKKPPEPIFNAVGDAAPPVSSAVQVEGSGFRCSRVPNSSMEDAHVVALRQHIQE